jgi:GT2 family glycosyltransferase/glycosyltransferase involved in cell wall biosynthesis
LIDVAKLSGVPIVFSFHDFYTVCPTVKLLDENNRYCDGFCTTTEGECKYDLWYGNNLPELKHNAISDWKAVMQDALLKCDAFVTTAESAKSIILKNFDMPVSARFEVISHGRDFPEFHFAAQTAELIEPLRVIVPGSIGYAKGAGLIEELAQCFYGRVEFHILGRLTEGSPISGIVKHGEYQRAEFVSRVKEIRPHIGAVFSIWPETYCHTLTELWAAGIPVIGLPLGAVGERLRETGAGWVAPGINLDAVANILHHILHNPSEILVKRSKVIEWQRGVGTKYNTTWMSDQYHKLYSSLEPSFLGNTDILYTNEDTESQRAISFREPLFPCNSAIELGTVSVIVPVHNALADVQDCLESLVENTFPAIELVIIDDGSDVETAQWVHTFNSKTPHIIYHRNEAAHGYTRAVNQGIKLAGGDILVILNSDTIVPPYWLERLVDPLLIKPDVAATGPVSNAATWQSVPKIRNSDNTWANNVLPPHTSVSDYDRFVQLQSMDLEPTPVALLNGFCYAVRASVFQEIGGLDERAFPSGYGEETDFFLKIKNRGYSSVLVPNLFVFHNKSRSFGTERRNHLSAAGNEVLYARYGKEFISAAANTLAKCTALETLRKRCAANEAMFTFSQRTKLKILFILPVAAGGGGVHSVAQEAQGIAALGHTVKVMVPQKHASSFKHYYPELCKLGVFITFANERDIVKVCKQNDVVVATHFFSIRLLKKARKELPDRLFLYYIQDYEPWIVPDDSPQFQEAFESYTTLNNAVLMAKTRWICRMVENKHGVQVHKIAPSIDHSIYFPDPLKSSVLDDRPLTISAMIRPKTPRRGAQGTINVLKALHEEFGGSLHIELFGCSDQDMDQMDVPADLPRTNHGVLTREGVADLLRQSDLFIDMSSYQAFGRTAVEAMACGGAAVIPENGGGGEYSWGGGIALPVPTDDLPLASKMIASMVRDRYDLEVRQRLGRNIASQFSINKASISILSLIEKHILTEGVS